MFDKCIMLRQYLIKIVMYFTGLQEFHKQETFCDYVLVAEGVEFKVHRVVMASCSDYFKVMLTGEMRESREGKVDLKGVSANGLRVVVDFAYTGSVSLTYNYALNKL